MMNRLNQIVFLQFNSYVLFLQSLYEVFEASKLCNVSCQWRDRKHHQNLICVPNMNKILACLERNEGE